jgi:hypothetical protein
MAKLSPVFNEAQFINGVPASGAKVFTYAAGSSTKLATYTDEGGTVPQANPIILNARGEPDSPIWLIEGQSYKFVFTASTDSDPPTSPIRTVDDVTGVGDNSVTLSQWVDSGVTPTYVSATQFTVPGDQTSAFHVNRRIKATVTAGTVYGYISASVFGALTTVTVVLDSGNLDSGLSAVQLGLVTANNTSLPQISNWVKEAMLQNDSVGARVLADSSLGFGMINGTLTASVAANALTIAIKTKAGADPSATDPVLILFRNATAATGDYSVLSLTAATSLVISSGSTLGTTSAVASRLWVVGFNDAGTFRLGVINLSTAVSIGDDVIASSTAEGGAGAADSAGVYYTGTAVASCPMRVLGFIESTQATAGTWATTPSKIQLVSSIYDTNPPLLSAGWNYLPEQATTSGTAINFTGIPSWATEIEVFLAGVSTTGTSNYIVQIGDSGGLETSGYLGASSGMGAAVGTTAYTTGFGLTTGAGTVVTRGLMRLALENGNTWTAIAVVARSDAANTILTAGDKTLSATLDRLTLTTVGGADTFDAGAARVRYR